MGLTKPRHDSEVTPPARGAVPASVVWHDLECGLYRADLPLWRELAEGARIGTPGARVLDVGAGTGRVTLDLARAGQALTALDLDAKLLEALSERAATEELLVETACADARSFELERGEFALCLAPMQTVQLLGGADGRMEFLACARAHMSRGALLACAIVTDLEPFDCDAGDAGPLAEVVRMDGLEYESRATRVQLRRRAIQIERERRIRVLDESARAGAPAGSVDASEPERDVIQLDRLSARDLQREGLNAGLSYVGTREIPSTDEHVGSEVVILRA